MLCTVFCAGGFFINYPFAVAVTLSRNNFLSNKNFITYRAVFALCETCFCTSGSNCFVYYFGVTLCGYFCDFTLFRAASAVL